MYHELTPDQQILSEPPEFKSKWQVSNLSCAKFDKMRIMRTHTKLRQALNLGTSEL